MKELFEIQQRLVSNKGNFNEFGKFSYRSLENILADVKPLLNELRCTITFTDDMVLIGERYYVKSTVTLENENGEKKDAVAFAREDESRAGMSESQVTGTASSYARKYAICSLLAINEEQDPDSMDNSHKTAKKQPTQYKPKGYTQTQQNDLEWKDETKDNLTVLTEYCSQVTANGFDRSEVGKFFRFYKDKCNEWRGTFQVDKLFSAWMSKAKSAA